jgi:hypothetical protein
MRAKVSSRYRIRAGLDQESVERLAEALRNVALAGYHHRALRGSEETIAPPGHDTLRMLPRGDLEPWRALARRIMNEIDGYRPDLNDA